MSKNLETRRKFRRTVAMLLCVQPVFWMSNVALAQSLQASPGNESTSSNFETGGVTMPGMGQPSSRIGQQPQAREEASTTRESVATPIDAPVDPDTYVLAHGDVLELNFWGIQNFTFRVVLDVEGRAFVPKVGYFELGGKTLTQARRTMRDAVARYYKLNFGVTLAQPRTFLVQIVGAVVHPGSYSSRATDRVATVLARAGEIRGRPEDLGRAGTNDGEAKTSGSRRRIEIRRRDGAVSRVDLLLFDLTGDVQYNPLLLDGDVVRVPFEEFTASIDGAVNRPGRYELVDSRDGAELLRVAGGLSPAATPVLPVRVIRRADADRQLQDLAPYVPGERFPSFALRSGDTVIVPAYTELQRMVTIVGAIAGATVARETQAPMAAGAVATSSHVAITPEEATATRHVAFADGDTVRAVVERAGGVAPIADLSGSYVLRSGRSIPVDLYRVIMLRDFGADRAVELGDTIVIPFKRRNILVEGAVSAPGSYPYNPSFGIEQYLSLAGGRNRFAKGLDDVRIVTPGGDMQQYRADLKVEPGSSVVVPERDFSRSEIVQILFGAAGILLSGVAVVLAARR